MNQLNQYLFFLSLFRTLENTYKEDILVHHHHVVEVVMVHLKEEHTPQTATEDILLTEENTRLREEEDILLREKEDILQIVKDTPQTATENILPIKEDQLLREEDLHKFLTPNLNQNKI
jgi:hypothetical protein